jgi:pimeloyl-ACP methyl ester carboxylesterase
MGVRGEPRDVIAGSRYRCAVTTTAVSVPGGSLHLLDEGPLSGTPIVLLHAAIADLRSWDGLVPRLTRAGHRVARYDLRGFGRSTTEDVEFSNRADLIAVLDALGVGRAVLVGNSRGGQVAIDTAIEFPDRVVAVVGVGSSLGGFEAEVTPEEQALFDEGDALESAADPDVAAIADLDVRVWVDGPGQSETRVPSRIRELVREMDAATYAPGSVGGRPIPLDPPAATRLSHLRCPVLAIAGALDMSDVALTARHLEAAAPDARAVILPDVAHMIGMEQPDQLAALIVEFLAPQPRWS